VGDRVETGQVIGLSGDTGRITGPHLHWDVFVNGIQVNPFTWLEQVFP
jgi:murein DD-endopeptidase MepM/ murein hydrolase activator NlpD